MSAQFGMFHCVIRSKTNDNVLVYKNLYNISIKNEDFPMPDITFGHCKAFHHKNQ